MERISYIISLKCHCILYIHFWCFSLWFFFKKLPLLMTFLLKRSFFITSIYEKYIVISFSSKEHHCWWLTIRQNYLWCKDQCWWSTCTKISSLMTFPYADIIVVGEKTNLDDFSILKDFLWWLLDTKRLPLMTFSIWKDRCGLLFYMI